MLCSAVLRFSGRVNVGTFHAADAKPGYRFGWPISRMMYKKTTTNSPVGSQYPGWLGNMPENTCRGITPSFRTAPIVTHFRPDVKPMEKYRDGKLNIVFVSRLEPRKGVDYLLPAFKEVKQQIPNSRLLIVGAGTRLRKGYEDWVKKQCLEQDVIFAGYATDSDLPRLFSNSGRFLCPGDGKGKPGDYTDRGDGDRDSDRGD